MWWEKERDYDDYGDIEKVREGWKCIPCEKWITDFSSIPKRKPLDKTVKLKLISDHPFCSKCNRKENLSVDHKHPIAFGGLDTPVNLQVLCRSCNASKSYSMAR